MTRRFWIAGPWTDLVIGCGGWSLPLLAISYVLTGEAARQASIAFYSLALLTNYPHYMATVYRAYGQRDRGAHHLYIVWGTAILIALGAIAHVRPALVPWLFTAYIMWSPWHYSGQNYGLLMMFLRRGGAEVSRRERRFLRVAFVASFVLLLAAFNESSAADPLVISIGLPLGVTRTVGVVAWAAFVTLGAAAFVTLAGRIDRRALTAAGLLFVTQGLWFVVPTTVAWVAGIAVPQTRYSSGILAVMHSAQYLWITQYFARRDEGARFDAGSYWLAVVLGGMALFLPVPWIASYAAHIDFTASMLIVTAIVNLHHFMLDGVVWKLRDPRVATALTTTEQPDAPPARDGASSLIRNPVVAGALVVLVTLAVVDQMRYRLASRQADPDAIAAALRINPYDSNAQLRLVRAHLDLAEQLDAAGQTERALAHYRAFLELVAVHRERRPNPDMLVPVLLEFGDALARTGRAADARSEYELAVSIAEQTGRTDLRDRARGRLEPR